MTSIEVDPEILGALAGALTEVSADLQWQAADAAEQGWALGPGDSAGALAAVLGDFEHQRQVLGRELDDLARRVSTAGRLYAEVDLEVGGWLDPSAAR
jgi:hypothetical protein